jgi:hypothetical protein
VHILVDDRVAHLLPYFPRMLELDDLGTNIVASDNVSVSSYPI